MDKVLTKNDKNIAKTEAVTETSDKSNNENTIGWRSEIISNNRVTDVLACRETNGYHGKDGYKEKENINGPCKEVKCFLFHKSITFNDHNLANGAEKQFAGHSVGISVTNKNSEKRVGG